MPKADDKLDWFPFYVLDFSGDEKVEAMSTLAVGAYILLLCKAWHATPPGTVPDDAAALAKLARVDDATWNKIQHEIRPCFRQKNGKLEQPRLAKEHRIAKKASKRRRKAASTAAESRWAADAERMRRECLRVHPTPTNTNHTNQDREEKKNQEGEPPVADGWLAGWKDTRTALRALGLGPKIADPLEAVPMDDVRRVWAEVVTAHGVKNRPYCLAYRLAQLHNVTLPPPRSATLRRALDAMYAKADPGTLAANERLNRARVNRNGVPA